MRLPSANLRALLNLRRPRSRLARFAPRVPFASDQKISFSAN